MINTSVTRVTDPRRSVFVEIRERGSENFVVFNQSSLYAVSVGRGRTRSAHFGAGFRPWERINVWNGVERDTFVEVFVGRDGLQIKPCRLHNVSTPYILIDGTPTAQHETVMEHAKASVVTTHERRAAFTRDVYNLAKSGDPALLTNSLRVLESYFFVLALANKIPREEAERKFNKYDKIRARIYRGATEGEQLNSFHLAYRMLAKACGLAEEASQ